MVVTAKQLSQLSTVGRSTEGTRDWVYEPGSFRDREGRVIYRDDRVYRLLSARAHSDWVALTETGFFRKYLEQGKLVPTREANQLNFSAPPPWTGVLEHEKVPVISYAYEWCYSMLKDAAILQLELLIAALEEEFTMKDGTPYNVQWLGRTPVFIDILSFERWSAGAPWSGYQQFCNLFLFPLFFQAHWNIPFHPWIRGQLRGISVEDMSRVIGLRDLLRPGIFKHAYLHSKLARAFSNTSQNMRRDLRQAGFHKELVQKNAQGLKRLVTGLRWGEASSHWVDYTNTNNYSDRDEELKRCFIGEIVTSHQYQLVWDLGCNTGQYAMLAARHAKYVVACDRDHAAVESLYGQLQREGQQNVLPLVIDLTDLSPNQGFRGVERKSLEHRIRPELILALALVHHLVITENVPVVELIEWFASLTSELVIEFVTKEDAMVQTLLRNKEDRYADYELDVFEQVLAEHFRIVRKQVLTSDTRILYHCVKTAG